DGKFIEDLADKKLKFRGSSNQRIFHNKEGKGEWVCVE
ncbi:MAG: 4Fe-4S cluster-binding domain-containing protein, partial [Cetobacterium sp.]